MVAERKNHRSEQGNISPEEETLQKIFEAQDPISQLLEETKSRKGPYKFYIPLAEMRTKFAQRGEARKEVLLKLTWEYLPQLEMIAGYRGMGVEDDDLLQNALFCLQETITATMIDGKNHKPGNVARFVGKCIRNSTKHMIMQTIGMSTMQFEEREWKRVFGRAIKTDEQPKVADGGAGRYAFGAQAPEKIYPPEPKKHWEAGDVRGYMVQALRAGKSLIEPESCPETMVIPDDWQAWVNYVRENSSRRNWGVATIGPDDKDGWSVSYTALNKPIDDFPATLAIGKLDVASRDQGVAKGGIEIHGHHTWWVPGGKWAEMEAKKGIRPGFTPADWYRFLINPDCQMMILADTLSVLMAVKTRQTVELDKTMDTISQQNFENYWLTRHNLMIHTGFQRWLFGGMIGGSKDLGNKSDLRNMGLEIANNHNVAFYSGPQDGTLFRCVP